MLPQVEADPGGLPWGRARVPTNAPWDLELGPEGSGMRPTGSGSGAASLEASIPTAMDAHEAEALREPPQSFTDTFNDNSHWVQPIF